MDELDAATTSWGTTSADDVDVRALRRYNRLLVSLAKFAELSCELVLAMLVASVIWLMTQVNFENAAFYDGTDRICIYEGQTGEIRNVE